MAKLIRPVAAVAATLPLVLLALFALFLSGSLRPAAAAEPCCQITGIGTSGGTVTAKESASGRTFQFAVKDRLLLSRLKVGQRIYANFSTKQVSVDGASFCCTIVSISATAPQAATKPTMAPSAPSPAITLPKVVTATGPVTRTAPRRSANWESRHLSTMVEGKRTDVEVLHLRGLDGIEAADIPESAKAFLLTHAKALPPDEVVHYVINKKQIEEWARTHPMPETLKKKKETHRKRGCNSISMKCARDGVKHVSNEVSKQAEALRKEARQEWKDVSREVGRGLKMAEGALLECFADHPIKSDPIKIPDVSIPVKVARPFAKQYSKGKVNGKVDGTANISFPMKLTEATVQVSAFVIPCAVVAPQLPVWVRPRSVSIKGVLTVTSTVDLEVNASGTFEESIRLIEPSANNFLTTVVFIHAVPIELDFGVEFESQIRIETSGVLHATLCDVRQRKVRLDFECDGKGCRGEQKNMDVQFPPIQNMQVAAEGRAVIKPWVLTALTANVNFGALSARVGPQFYVSAEVQGAGSSGTVKAGTVATAASLSAKLYAGVDMLYFLHFLRPEFAPGTSPVKPLNGGTPGLKNLLWSKSVSSPSAAAQSSKAGSVSARCAK